MQGAEGALASRCASKHGTVVARSGQRTACRFRYRNIQAGMMLAC